MKIGIFSGTTHMCMNTHVGKKTNLNVKSKNKNLINPKTFIEKKP
jgi:hypothetical protein